MRKFLTGTGISLMLFLLPLTAAAQGNSFVLTTQSGVASVISFLIASLNLLTWVMFLILSILLDPQFIFGTIKNVDLETVLNSIWVLSRDLMNIGFALILIGAAIYTIVTAKKGFAADHLKSFVMCVVLVNFSWFIPRVIIDVGNVTAAVVYGIPSLIANGTTANKCVVTTRKSMAEDGVECTGPVDGIFTCKCAMVTNARFFMDAETARKLDTENAATGNSWYCPLGSVFCVQLTNLDINAVSGHSAVLNGLIVNHARLQQLAVVPQTQAGVSEVQGIIMFLLSSMITLAVHIALFFPLAAMVIAFAIRIPVLWLTVSFMPFTLLKFVVPSEYIGEYPQKIWDHFLKAAFLPAIVGVPLSVGFIMVNSSATMIAGVPQFGQLTNISFGGAAGVDNFFQLLWQAMTLGVLWVGVFSTLEKMGIMGTGAGFLKGIGESLGGIALKAPLSIPIPGPSGASMTPLAMLKTLDPRRVNYALSNGQSLSEAFGKTPPGGKKSAASPETAAAGDKLAKIDEKGFTSVNDTLKEVASLITQGKRDEADKLIREQLATKLNVPDAKSENIEDTMIAVRDEMQRRGADAGRIGDISTRITELAKAKEDAKKLPPAPGT